uniref:Uncharacterized protein n=1 Tax=Lepeophtheirus salmonis TaxID=72036 RepID=A0A0K2VI98_LEPSM
MSHGAKSYEYIYCIYCVLGFGFAQYFALCDGALSLYKINELFFHKYVFF